MDSFDCLLNTCFDHNCFLFVIGRKLEKKSDVCKNHGEPCGYTRGDQFPENVGACCGGLRCDQNPKSSDGLPLLGGAGKCVKSNFLSKSLKQRLI